MEQEEGGDECMNGEPGREDDNTAVGVVEEVGDDLLLEWKHIGALYASMELFAVNPFMGVRVFADGKDAAAG